MYYDVYMYKFTPCCPALANVQHMYTESVCDKEHPCIIISNLSVFY